MSYSISPHSMVTIAIPIKRGLKVLGEAPPGESLTVTIAIPIKRGLKDLHHHPLTHQQQRYNCYPD